MAISKGNFNHLPTIGLCPFFSNYDDFSEVWEEDFQFTWWNMLVQLERSSNWLQIKEATYTMIVYLLKGLLSTHTSFGPPWRTSIQSSTVSCEQFHEISNESLLLTRYMSSIRKSKKKRPPIFLKHHRYWGNDHQNYQSGMLWLSYSPERARPEPVEYHAQRDSTTSD